MFSPCYNTRLADIYAAAFAMMFAPRQCSSRHYAAADPLPLFRHAAADAAMMPPAMLILLLPFFRCLRCHMLLLHTAITPPPCRYAFRH